MTGAGVPAPLIETVVGHERDPDVVAALHRLEHRSAVEYVHIDASDSDRTRLRVTSDVGHEYRIALTSASRLLDGMVLLLRSDRAVVVRAQKRQVMVLRALSTAAALRLGFLAGHLHWKSTFTADILEVSMESRVEDYLDRIADLTACGAVVVVST